MSRPEIGIFESFSVRRREKVEEALRDLKALGIAHLRTEISGADAGTPEGEAWYDWLLPRLAQEAEIVPVFRSTEGLDSFVERYGRHFEYVELASSLIYALPRMKRLGKKTVLGGLNPANPSWADLIGQADAVGVRGDSSTDWNVEIGKVRRILEARKSDAKIWIVETGHSTWRNDALGQAAALFDALAAPVERVYWRDLRDSEPQGAGLKTSDGQPKTLYRLWSAGGLDLVREMTAPTPHVGGSEPVTLITGGAGFVGTNVATRELEEGRRVRIFDNLSRSGVEHNVRWLKAKYGDRVELQVGDVRDREAVRRAVRGAERAYHFAAQVAVTTSLERPINDFEVNAVGTVNLLEELRRLENPPSLLFTSTNKVYGDLEDVALKATKCRYEPKDLLIRSSGIGEDRSLDFHSPYGCSKGTADQYVLDYGRSYGLQTVVFRMSCIYGPHQFGNEDQGWVAHFLIRALNDEPITLYGDGKQVRDILFVEDLAAAMHTAHEKISLTAGQAFNIGGGPENTTSLLELVDLIGAMTGAPVKLGFSDWRVGDQRYYVSDTTRYRKLTGWQPRVNVEQGVYRLSEWLVEESPTVKARRALVKKAEEYARSVTVR